MPLGISSDWDEPYYPKPRKKSLTDKELATYADAVRGAAYSLVVAEQQLHGVFGYGHDKEQMAERDRKVDIARKKVAEAMKTLDKIKDLT